MQRAHLKAWNVGLDSGRNRPHKHKDPANIAPQNQNAGSPCIRGMLTPIDILTAAYVGPFLQGYEALYKEVRQAHVSCQGLYHGSVSVIMSSPGNDMSVSMLVANDIYTTATEPSRTDVFARMREDIGCSLMLSCRTTRFVFNSHDLDFRILVRHLKICVRVFGGVGRVRAVRVTLSEAQIPGKPVLMQPI